MTPTGLGTPDGAAAFASAAAADCTSAQVLRNPGFETGRQDLPWVSAAHVLTRAVPGVSAHSGSWLAWLDGYGVVYAGKLAQAVTIPAGCRHATFSFWLHIKTDDRAGPAADTLAVQVLNSAAACTARWPRTPTRTAPAATAGIRSR